MQKFLFKMSRIILLISATLCPFEASAFTAENARACVINGLNDAKQAQDMRKYIRSKLDKNALAARAAQKLGYTAWSATPESIKGEIFEAIEKRIRDIKGNSINFDTVVTLRFVKPVSRAYEVSGYYYEVKDKDRERRQNFAIHVLPECKVADLEHNNAQLSTGIKLDVEGG